MANNPTTKPNNIISTAIIIHHPPVFRLGFTSAVTAVPIIDMISSDLFTSIIPQPLYNIIFIFHYLYNLGYKRYRVNKSKKRKRREKLLKKTAKYTPPLTFCRIKMWLHLWQLFS